MPCWLSWLHLPPLTLHAPSLAQHHVTHLTRLTGQRMIRDEDIPEGVKPVSINPLGNYAVQASWFVDAWVIEPLIIGYYLRDSKVLQYPFSGMLASSDLMGGWIQPGSLLRTPFQPKEPRHPPKVGGNASLSVNAWGYPGDSRVALTSI